MKHNCIVCEKEIERIEMFDSDEDWQGCFSDGIVHKIEAGYGSLLDGDMFIIAICDKCVVDKKLKWVGNYMFPDFKEFDVPKKLKK